MGVTRRTTGTGQGAGGAASLALCGESAFSAFRVERLQRVIGDALGRPVAVNARFVYLLDIAGALGADEIKRCASLLSADAVEPLPSDGFYVAPRAGTISPWSSKAGEILRHCGLGEVRRVERVLHFVVRSAQGRVMGLSALEAALPHLHDRMTEHVYADLPRLFDVGAPAPYRVCDVLGLGREALTEADAAWGLALSDDEMDYLLEACRRAGRNLTDAELVMFGQVNSEHCRHKIFNARWVVDNTPADLTLFEMIRHTHASHPEQTLLAYRDNAAVIEGWRESCLAAYAEEEHRYRFDEAQLDVLIKVETHNHPTAISPFPGAATGVGGEIRDEAATGRGGRSKAGLCGFMVSHLRIPDAPQPWETKASSFPGRLATPLRIMLDGPIGGAAFGNEFGRPLLCGFFRTYEAEHAGRRFGYHKPVMLAGGMGNIQRNQVFKRDISTGALIVQLGGPALRIGLGGGAASSMGVGSNDEALDFDSVQRGNAEMERRCQEVIDACVVLGDRNPVISIHDVGAGGLSNACPELIEETGATFDLRAIPNQEPSLSPMEIWCCEAQERYVLAIDPADRELFMDICRRERCPAAVIGVARDDRRLVLEDRHFGNRPIDMPIAMLLGKPPRVERRIEHLPVKHQGLSFEGIKPIDALERVLQLPAVADKTFLITIADRSVTGLVCRDPMVGSYQVPVADVAVTSTGYRSLRGEAMAVGERSPLAVLDAPASGRMAVAEALTNIAAADIGAIGRVKLSANWMCACGDPSEDLALYETVKAVAMTFCPALGISIPVGKDSLSMRTAWTDAADGQCKQSAPLTLIVSAFAPVSNVRRTATPDFKPGASFLVRLDVNPGRRRLGGSALAQVYCRGGGDPPDIDDPARLTAFFAAVQKLVSRRLILAYHDISDGGLVAAVAEMAFAGGRGAHLRLPAGDDVLAELFAEEAGAVLQVRRDRLPAVLAVLAENGFENVGLMGDVTDALQLRVDFGGEPLFDAPLSRLRAWWSALTVRMQIIRDNPVCAREQEALLNEPEMSGMRFHLTYAVDEPIAPKASEGAPRRVAVLREQGINGHVEMAAALTLVGFEAVDVHMSDLIASPNLMERYDGLVACGGFSYGDVLGAGSGWARTILFHESLREAFASFFARPDTFTLGVCNGCQMLSQIKDLIPGAAAWPRFLLNTSEQFEARYVTVEVLESPSIFLRGMRGSRLPVPVAHGEGRVCFDASGDANVVQRQNLAVLRYVDGSGGPTERYPLNPNGSAGGLTSFTSLDGRATIMMPHPERAFRAVQLAYRPEGFCESEAGPWLRMFQNAFMFAKQAGDLSQVGASCH